jgi:hypothetical protein
MPHTITSILPVNSVQYLQLTVTSYTNGTGETFTLSSLGLDPFVTNVVPLLNPSNRNSLNAMIFPVWASGTLKLYEFSSGSPVEIPTTTALNAIFDVVIFAVGE